MLMKYWFPVLLIFISAEEGYSQAEFGFFAGPQATTARYYTPEFNVQRKKQETEFKFGFQAGAMMKMQFENGLFFSPAVFYSLKGYRVTLTSPSIPPDSAAIDNDVSVHTIEFAPMLQYNFNNNPRHFYVKTGPSIDLQFSGKEKFNKQGGGSESRNMKFGFGDYGYIGANLIFQLGYETDKGLIVFGQFSYGVGSIVNTDEGARILHQAAGISIGKYLSRKKIVLDTRNKQ